MALNNRQEDIEYKIWVGTVVTVVAATAAVMLRFVSRNIARVKLWWDDWVIVVSLVVNWAMAITRWIQVLGYDFGEHGDDIPIYHIVSYQKSFIAIQLLYFSNAVLTKSSLLLLYHRTFGVVEHFCWALWVSWFLVAGYFVACVIASIISCIPVSYMWHRFEDPRAPGSCYNEIAFFRWNGFANMLLDILMLILPLPMVWQMGLCQKQRLLLTGIFLMGGFVCIVSILRITSFDHSVRNDPTFTQVPSSMWSSVEQGLEIVCACLPTLRPLLRLCGCRGPNRSRSSSNHGQSQSPYGPGSNRLSQFCDHYLGPDLEHADSSPELQCEEEIKAAAIESRRWADDAYPTALGLSAEPSSLDSVADIIDLNEVERVNGYDVRVDVRQDRSINA
ncbi:hypothetical protein BDW74DRAFT_84770 [Aspergillus multicolor]|uniref:uncharacterized protein n=1 Tax=Aspergillus multicolor TaxID=41759 RepID=UPI003CCDA062